jgi:tripartite-type tricarboxylate transporter receptor subunit TctC
MKFMQVFANVVTLAGLLVVSGTVHAQQSYPDKPIRLVVPYPPGGSTVTLARLIGEALREAWGQQVIVDPRGGGNTVVGTEQVSRASPDGYTLLLTTNGHVVVPQMVTTTFNPIKDFVPVAGIAITEYILVVHPSVQANTVEEFIALAKARPNHINYASAGSGSANHLAGELFATMTGAQIQHIPYKGSGPAVADLLGGQVQSSFQTPIVALPHITAGTMRALAVTGATRLPAAPQVPTFAQSGLPGFSPGTWFGIVAPAGTPQPIAAKLAGELNRIVSNPEFRGKLTGLGLTPAYVPTVQFEELIRTDFKKFGDIIKRSGIKID